MGWIVLCVTTFPKNAGGFDIPLLVHFFPYVLRCLARTSWRENPFIEQLTNGFSIYRWVIDVFFLNSISVKALHPRTPFIQSVLIINLIPTTTFQKLVTFDLKILLWSLNTEWPISKLKKTVKINTRCFVVYFLFIVYWTLRIIKHNLKLKDINLLLNHNNDQQLKYGL